MPASLVGRSLLWLVVQILGIVEWHFRTSDQKHPMLDAGTRARVANFVGCGAKFGRKSTDCKTSPVDGIWDQV